MEERLFLQTIGFPAEPLDPVPVHSPLEMTAAGAETGLERRFGGERLEQVADFEGKDGKTPSFPKNPLNLLAALELFFSFPGVWADRLSLF